MIGTLFAQDVRATRATVLGSIGIALLVAVVSLTATALRIPVLGPVGLTIGVIVTAVIIPFVLGLLVEYYWRTMYGREGYFTMSLPVRGRTLFAAKVLYGVCATLVALIATGISLLLVAVAIPLSQRQGPFDLIRATYEQLRQSIEVAGIGMPLFIVFALLVQLVFLVIAGAALMSIGARSRFNHLGFGAPVLGAILTYLVMQVLALAAMLFVPFGIRISGPDAGSFVAEGMFSEFVRALSTGGGEQPGVVGVGVVFVGIAATVFFAWSGARSVERHTSLR